MICIHAGEGGSDAASFCHELSSYYLKYAQRLGLEFDILDSSESRLTLWFKGTGVQTAFANESGKHVIQRVPSNGGGRRHTSVVGVAVMPILASAKPLNPHEVTWVATRGSGNGGQAKNKTSSKVICQHVPTGITASSDSRSQSHNREIAMRILASRVHEYHMAKTTQSYNQWRDQQLDGMGRGNKRRTWNCMRNEVVDHLTGKVVPLWKLVEGELNLLR